jgi:CheY-like chemotaxis protein
MTRLEPIKILMIEDSSTDVELTQEFFEESKIKISFFAVKDGKEAVDFLWHTGAYADKDQFPRPELILLDIKLPKLNGLELLPRIKRDDHLKHIPVVVLTTSDQDNDIKLAYELGANSYLIKPADLEDFSKTLQKLEDFWLVVAKIPKGGTQ